jgi:SNF2 family DNA or RNA helicase
MKKDVLPELPDKTEEKILVELTEKQKKLYTAYLEHYKGELDLESDEFIEHNQIQILSVLMRLRQICCHPATFLDNYDGDSAKMELLTDLLQNAIESGHRVLVFSQFTSMLDLLAKDLEKEHIPFYTITGSTPKERRLTLVKAFNEDETPVFLISLRAGGTGLNLVGADVVIHYDPWWNIAVENQATDRAFRIGQDKNVMVHKFVCRGSIEEKIDTMIESKKELAENVIGSGGESWITELSNEELFSLLKLD